jgi:hypothetical protein
MTMRAFPIPVIAVFLFACGSVDVAPVAKIARVDEAPSQPVLLKDSNEKDRSAFGAGVLDEAEPAPGQAIWSRRFGGVGSTMGVSIAATSDGGMYVLGQFYETMDTGLATTHRSAGREDIFLLKLDRDGNPLWSRSFGGKSHDYADHVVVDAAGDVFITGSFMEKIDFGGKTHRCRGVHDVFIAKLDGDGNYLWSKTYGDQQDQICLRPLPSGDGGVFLAGYFRGVVNLGGKPHRSYPDKAAFVGRLDAGGKRVWSEQFGHIFDYAMPGLALVGNGDLIYGGGSDPTREFTGKRMKRIDRMADLGVVVARYDASGKRLWRKRFGGGSDNLHTEVALGPYGDIVVAGSFGGTVNFGGEDIKSASRSDIYVAALDPEGKHLWSRRFGGGRYQYLSGLAVDGEGNTYIAGQFMGGNIDFGGRPLEFKKSIDGAFMAKLDGSGAHLWSRRFEGGSLRFPGGIDLDSSGDVLVCGSFSDWIDLGNGPLVSAGRHDVFVAKIGH